jgi:hypothetical protein
MRSGNLFVFLIVALIPLSLILVVSTACTAFQQGFKKFIKINSPY